MVASQAQISSAISTMGTTLWNGIKYLSKPGWGPFLGRSVIVIASTILSAREEDKHSALLEQKNVNDRVQNQMQQLITPEIVRRKKALDNSHSLVLFYTGLTLVSGVAALKSDELIKQVAIPTLFKDGCKAITEVGFTALSDISTVAAVANLPFVVHAANRLEDQIHRDLLKDKDSMV